MHRNTFNKHEHLKSKQAIGQLFTEGKQLKKFPLLMLWRLVPKADTAYPSKAAITVSKRNFKSAVHRNRIKRLIREAWRLQKHELNEDLLQKNAQLECIIIYIAREERNLSQIEKSLKHIIVHLKKQL